MRTIIIYAIFYFIGKEYSDTFTSGFIFLFLAALFDALIAGGGKDE